MTIGKLEMESMIQINLKKNKNKRTPIRMVNRSLPMYWLKKFDYKKQRKAKLNM